MTPDTMPDVFGTPWHPYGDDAFHKRMAETDFPGRHLLHLSLDEWDAIERLRGRGVPLHGIGSRCAYTPLAVSDRLTSDGGTHSLRHHLVEAAWVCDDTEDAAYDFRPSPVMGGTFLIFAEQ